MPLPIISPEWLSAAVTFLVFAGVVLFAGRGLLRVIGRSSPARRRHGRFVLGWMLAGWLVGAAVRLCLSEDGVFRPYKADAGLAILGLLVGWAVGMAHGGIMLLVSPTKTADPPSWKEVAELKPGDGFIKDK